MENKNMGKLERIGVSLDQKLLNMFDELITKHGYQNRSEAIRDLIRTQLSEDEIQKTHAKAVAGIFIVYDHHHSDLNKKLTDLQHNHLLQTISSVHVHLDHDNCLEIIILKGMVKDIKTLADKITSLKGVKLSRLNMMTTGKKIV